MEFDDGSLRGQKRWFTYVEVSNHEADGASHADLISPCRVFSLNAAFIVDLLWELLLAGLAGFLSYLHSSCNAVRRVFQ